MRFARLSLFFSLALMLRPALAQSNAKPAPSTPIRYSRDLPHSVLKLMPRGAKSLFWGTFVPKKGSALMAIHLFNQTSEEPRYNFTRMLELDLFQRHGRSWRAIRRVPVQYPAAFGGTDKAVDTQFFWVDPQRKIPLFKFRVFDPSGFRGAIGDEVAVFFPNGFARSATIQSWEWGSWSSSLSIGQELDWSQRDENGFLQVVSEEGFSGTPQRQKRVWRWNGEKFKAFKG